MLSGSGRAILGANDGLDVPPDVPVGGNLGATRLDGGYEVIQDLVCHRLMEDVLVAISVEVELPGAQLDDMLIRHVHELDGGKIWIAGAGTLASELRVAQVDRVVAMRRRV